MENAVELQLPVHGDGHGQCLGQRHRPYLKVSVPFPSDFGSSLFFATVTAVVCTSGRLQQGHIQFIPTSGPCSLNFMTDTNHFHVLSQGPPSGYRGPVHHLFSASLLQKYGYFYQSPRVWWQKGLPFLPAWWRQVRIHDTPMQMMVRVLCLWKQANQTFIGAAALQKNIRQGLKIKMAELAMVMCTQNTSIMVRGKLPHPQALGKFIQSLQFSKVTRFYLPKRDVSRVWWALAAF